MVFSLDVPQGMDAQDQQRFLEIVGASTSSKFLSNSYPLGGYSGLETSLSFDMIDSQEVSSLGNGTNSSAGLKYPTLTIGKGLYNNSDLFFQFVPPSKTMQISKFGASLRWSFYQGLYLPINASLLLNADTASIRGRVTTRNLGSDIMLGLNLSQFSFFMGGGYVLCWGDFVGGSAGVTASLVAESRRVKTTHLMFGATYNFEPFFIGVSLNRYRVTNLSLKAGFLF